MAPLILGSRGTARCDGSDLGADPGVAAAAVEPIGGCWIWYDGTPPMTSPPVSHRGPTQMSSPRGPQTTRSRSLRPRPRPAARAPSPTPTTRVPRTSGPAAQVEGTFVFSVNGGNKVQAKVDYGVISTGQSIPGKTLKIPFKVLEGENEVVFERVSSTPCLLGRDRLQRADSRGPRRRTPGPILSPPTSRRRSRAPVPTTGPRTRPIRVRGCACRSTCPSPTRSRVPRRRR